MEELQARVVYENHRYRLNGMVDILLSGIRAVLNLSHARTRRKLHALHIALNQRFYLIQARVVYEKANVGLAFDGDADRLLAVDENGNIVDGDQIMAIVGPAHVLLRQTSLSAPPLPAQFQGTPDNGPFYDLLPWHLPVKELIQAEAERLASLIQDIMF